MSPYLAYFLGLLTIIIIGLLFWIMARFNPAVRQVYLNTICNVEPPDNNGTTVINSSS